MENKDIVLLHLSDLHFNEKLLPYQINDNKTVLDTLISALEVYVNRNVEWKPEYVIITGDIAWSASDNEYKSAKIFFKELISKLKLDVSKFIIIPGNHDKKLFDLEVEMLERINEEKIAIDKLKERQTFLTKKLDDYDINYFYKRYDSFNKFCDEMGFSKPIMFDPKNHANQQYTHGFYTFKLKEKNLVFWSVNTTWLCFAGDMDYGNLALEKNSVSLMKNYIKERFDDRFVITLMHHNPTWLRWSDQYSDADSPSFFKTEIVKISDIIFTGHEHAVELAPNLLDNEALIFYGGTVFSKGSDGKRYNGNNFNLSRINIANGNIRTKPFVFRPTGDEQEYWKDRESKLWTLAKPINVFKENIEIKKLNKRLSLEIEYLKREYLKVSKHNSM